MKFKYYVYWIFLNIIIMSFCLFCTLNNFYTKTINKLTVFLFLFNYIIGIYYLFGENDEN